MRSKLLYIKGGMSSYTNASLKFLETLISIPIGRIQGDADCVKDWYQNATGWLENYQSNLDADILVAKDTGKRNALAWHHNLWDLMLGVSFDLEVKETI